MKDYPYPKNNYNYEKNIIFPGKEDSNLNTLKPMETI